MASNLSKFVFKNGSFLCHQENTFLLLNCYKNITTTTCVVQQKKKSTLKKQTCILLRKKVGSTVLLTDRFRAAMHSSR